MKLRDTPEGTYHRLATNPDAKNPVTGPTGFTAAWHRATGDPTVIRITTINDGEKASWTVTDRQSRPGQPGPRHTRYLDTEVCDE